MARGALTSSQRFGRGPSAHAALVPTASVIAASLLAALPFVSNAGWFPDFGFLAFISWRLLRADPWPAWWAAPLGLVNDLFTGDPLGFSMALWSAAMLALDLIDRRTMWRDYWIEWMLAAVLILVNETAQWQVARMSGAQVPIALTLPPLLISICVFPLVAWLVSRIDRWRLGRR